MIFNPQGGKTLQKLARVLRENTIFLWAQRWKRRGKMLWLTKKKVKKKNNPQFLTLHGRHFPPPFRRCHHIAYFWVHSFANLLYLGKEKKIQNMFKCQAWVSQTKLSFVNFHKSHQRSDKTCQYCEEMWRRSAGFRHHCSIPISMLELRAMFTCTDDAAS